MPLPRSLDVSDDLWKFAGATRHRATLTPVPMWELEPQFIIGAWNDVKKLKGTCIRCGLETDSRIGETWICETCYEVRSSCCPEFGPDDLTGLNDGVSDKEDTADPQRE